MSFIRFALFRNLEMNQYFWFILGYFGSVVGTYIFVEVAVTLISIFFFCIYLRFDQATNIVKHSSMLLVRLVLNTPVASLMNGCLPRLWSVLALVIGACHQVVGFFSCQKNFARYPHIRRMFAAFHAFHSTVSMHPVCKVQLVYISNENFLE